MTLVELLTYFHLSFIVRLLLAFTLMMAYYNWVDKTGLLWKITEWPWKFFALIFFIADVLYNYLMIPYTLDLPRRWGEPVTERITRYVKTLGEERSLLNRWRYGIGVVFCRFLHMSDPGHCGGWPK